jgi:hypothetical protein
MGLYFLAFVIGFAAGALTVIGLAALHFAGDQDDTDQAGV